MIYDKFRDEILLFNPEGELFYWLKDRWEPHYCTRKPSSWFWGSDSCVASLDENTSEVLFVIDYYHGSDETWRWNGNDWHQDFSSSSTILLYSDPPFFDNARNKPLTLSEKTHDKPDDLPFVNGSYSGYTVTFEKTSDSLRLLAPHFRIPLCSLGGLLQDATSDSLILQGERPWRGAISGCDVSPPVTWERNLSHWFWRWDVNQLTSGEGITISYDDLRRQALSFGGIICYDDLQGPSNNTFIWDGDEWERAKSDALPSARYYSAMAYDTHRSKIILFGGLGLEMDDYPFTEYCVNDTWIWNGSSWDEDDPTSFPSPRCGHAMAYDEAHKNVVLFGGRNEFGNIFKDTWIYDGENWRQVFPEHTPDVFQPGGMFYNKARRRITLFGHYTDRIYEWDGTDWRLYDVPNTPILFFGSRFVYDKKENCLWLYCAKGKPGMPGSYNSLWRLGFGPEAGLTLERLISHLLGDAPFKMEELPYADLNQDGRVDMADGIFLLSQPDKSGDEPR